MFFLKSHIYLLSLNTNSVNSQLLLIAYDINIKLYNAHNSVLYLWMSVQCEQNCVASWSLLRDILPLLLSSFLLSYISFSLALQKHKKCVFETDIIKKYKNWNIVWIYVKVTMFLPPFRAGRLEQCDDLVENRMLLQGSALWGRQWTGALAPIKKETKLKRMIKPYLVIQNSPVDHQELYKILKGGFNHFCSKRYMLFSFQSRDLTTVSCSCLGFVNVP